MDGCIGRPRIAPLQRQQNPRLPINSSIVRSNSPINTTRDPLNLLQHVLPSSSRPVSRSPSTRNNARVHVCSFQLPTFPSCAHIIIDHCPLAHVQISQWHHAGLKRIETATCANHNSITLRHCPNLFVSCQRPARNLLPRQLHFYDRHPPQPIFTSPTPRHQIGATAN